MGYIMALYVAILHLIWMTLLIYDPVSASGATPVFALMEMFYFHQNLLVVALLIASVLAISTLILDMPWSALALVPQQWLLIVSSYGSFVAIITMQFADGVARPWPFIMADQIHIIVACAVHAVGVVAMGVESVRNTIAKTVASGHL